MQVSIVTVLAVIVPESQIMARDSQLKVESNDSWEIEQNPYKEGERRLVKCVTQYTRDFVCFQVNLGRRVTVIVLYIKEALSLLWCICIPLAFWSPLLDGVFIYVLK